MNKISQPVPITVSEGISGMWHYHVSDNGGTRGLCGKQTMSTAVTLQTWGFKPGHMPTRYCKECATLAEQRGIQLGKSAKTKEIE